MLNKILEDKECPYCNCKTNYDMCDGCYFVKVFIDDFLKTEKGIEFIEEKLKEAKEKIKG